MIHGWNFSQAFWNLAAIMSEFLQYLDYENKVRLCTYIVAFYLINSICTSTVMRLVHSLPTVVVL